MSMEPSGRSTHGFQLHSAGIRRHPHAPMHLTQPSKPPHSSHNASPYQPGYQQRGFYGPQLHLRVDSNFPNVNLAGPSPRAHNAQRHPGRQQHMPQPQQPGSPSMMCGPVSQSAPHNSNMAQEKQQQQHRGHPSHERQPDQQQQGRQNQSIHPQQQQQSHLQRQQQQQLQHQHHAQQQYQVTPQHMAHQLPPHQQPRHLQQQPTPQHLRSQQPQPHMSPQQPMQDSQQPPQQQPQPQPQFPKAQPQTQIPPPIQLQTQAQLPKAGRVHTPQQEAPQPASPAQMDVDVVDIDGSQEGHSGMPEIDSQMCQDPSFQPSHPMGEMMSPPPEGGSYPTLEAVQKAVLRYGTSVGYSVVIGRSKKSVQGLKKVLFVCDRAGKPPSRENLQHGKRKRSSRKCNCPFSFFAIEQQTQWTIRRRPDKQHLQHNHGPSESPSHHLVARKLGSKKLPATKQLKETGTPSRLSTSNLSSSSIGVGVSETPRILPHGSSNRHLPSNKTSARRAIDRSPPKPPKTPGAPEKSPTIYTKEPQEIRSELRCQLWKARTDLKKVENEKNEEIDALKETIKAKDTMIAKFEMFIDICNQRVMVQRERISGPSEDGIASAATRNRL